MKNIFNAIIQFKLVSGVFALSFALIGGAMLWSFIALKDISQPLIVSYGLGVVNKAGGSVWHLLAFGFSTLIALGFNFAISLLFEERDWFWGKFIAAGSLFLSLLIFIGFAAIISVN